MNNHNVRRGIENRYLRLAFTLLAVLFLGILILVSSLALLEKYEIFKQETLAMIFLFFFFPTLPLPFAILYYFFRYFTTK